MRSGGLLTATFVRGLVLGLGLGGAAACGEVTTFTDAATDGATVDAAVDAPPPGQVTVMAYQRGWQPSPGEPARDVDVFASADGAVVATGRTGADGRAVLADVPHGAAVTAIYPRPTGAELVTFHGVGGGDTLTVGESPRERDWGNATGTMTLTWAPIAGASFYEIYDGCTSHWLGGGQTSLAITRYERCNTAPFDLMATAVDDSGALLRWTLVADLAFQPGQSYALSSWQSATTTSLRATGVPAAVDWSLMAAGVRINGGDRFYTQTSQLVPAGGMVAATLATAGIGRDGLAAVLHARVNVGVLYDVQLVASGATSVTFDGSFSIPWTMQAWASASARQVGWIEVGEGAYDAAAVSFQWWSYPPDGASLSYRWTMIAPHGLHPVPFPAFPAALARHAPADDQELEIRDWYLFDFAADDAYAETRQRPEWEFRSLDGAPVKVSIPYLFFD